MDFYDSKAAVDAMKALQDRIRELEKNNSKVRKECAQMRSLVEQDEQTLGDREASLIAAADKAQKMLDGASETLVELRRVRRENRDLQQRAADLKKQLEERIAMETTSRTKLLKISNRRENAERLIAEYEALFCELLSPPNFALTGHGNVPFNHTTISVTTHSLPATLQTCVQMLQTLPVPFRDQKLEKKREIIAILLNARNIAYKMAEEIHRLELQLCESGSQRRIQAEIDVKSSHLGLVTQAMQRFRFD
jgi:cell division septum initiation protein DivIVA